ncbi:peptidase E [Gelidibacter japonicus]|uniref:DUF6702 family protein n=1 Tax=Gelidibacter japonicus TaxID=1962232 RepID=UPI002020AC77|nr:DUF6702 family protein [Gelidibacter japonicus]MCL8006728.1 peptidase E [Gelidibacter japonicus]
MNIIKIFVLVLVFPLLLSVNAHKFYVSVTEVAYVNEKKSVQIITRIFIDDLENALRQRYNKHLTFAPENEAEEVEIYLERYLKDKISIQINDKIVAFKYVGREYDNDIVFCYLEITDVKEIKSFQISNKVLFESFDDQQNIVKLKINDQNKSVILINQSDNVLLKF